MARLVSGSCYLYTPLCAASRFVSDLIYAILSLVMMLSLCRSCFSFCDCLLLSIHFDSSACTLSHALCSFGLVNKFGLVQVSPAVLLCTVFWGALAIGRPLGLMMLDIFSRRQLLCCNTIGAGLSLSWLLVGPTNQVFWFCAAAGFGLSIAGNVPSTMSQVCAQSEGQLGGRMSWAAKGSCEVCCTTTTHFQSIYSQS